MNSLTQKRCPKCEKIKTIEKFSRDNSTSNGFCVWCKECVALKNKEWRKSNPHKEIFYREKNREKITEYQRTWRSKNKEHISIWGKEYYIENEDLIKNKSKKYRLLNKEKVKESKREYISKNYEKVKERISKWIKSNREHIKNKRREYYKNSEKISIDNKNYRARKKNSVGIITVEEWENLKEKYGNICLCCKRGDLKLTIDHIIPLSKGGRNTIENIQPLCSSCNSRKKDKEIDYRL